MWWKDAKFYELYVDKFAGDFAGLAARLGYLEKLGVTALHILPHYPSPMVDQGYDISDYRGVRPELGTLEDFKACIDAAHEKGIRVITDFVLNHVSDRHPWFVEARSSKDNPKRDWFLWSGTGSEFALARNPFPEFKARNWIPNVATDDCYYATFYAEQPDLNWDNPEVVDAMLAAMDFWADMGVDGFRLDAACYLIKREGTACAGLPETHQAIKRIRAHLDEKYPRGIALLAEAAQSVEEIKEYFGNGDECHLAYHFPLMTYFWAALKDRNPDLVRDMIAQSLDIPGNCQWAVFLRNHDEIELKTLPIEDQYAMVDWFDPEHRYVMKKGTSTCLRVADACKGDQQEILTAFDLLYSTPFAPVMYYGDEIGMRTEPVRPGVLDPRTYVRGTFDWAEAERQMADPHSLFNRTSEIVRRVPTPEIFPEMPEIAQAL